MLQKRRDIFGHSENANLEANLSSRGRSVNMLDRNEAWKAGLSAKKWFLSLALTPAAIFV